ncbi:hypothetical protein EDD17DRAFT_1472565 [Pisolithus thermaeus]|nr:hypothetical protein EV401DRAFT_2252922 [Pisolithus croceorrhizus]KAI6165774.1 hypothetical protein EDD17DRAFT_1472565 [Pisolithus thermaeus]
MVQFSLSPFERLAYTRPVLDLIAFYVAVDPFLGPPSNLVSLLLASRTVHEHLCVKNNPHLYSEIFRYKFDVAALERRLYPAWTSASCLASELRLRCVALKYIRRGRVSGPPDRDALWRSYLMMLENEGRNEQHLCQWANLHQWALSAVALRCLPLRDYDDLPPDPEGTSLALWLLWMTSKRVRSEGTIPCGMVLSSVLPLLVRGYQYPSFLAPDTHFYLPLCDEHDTITAGFSGTTTLVSSVHYCAHQLQLAVPPLTPAALLNYLVRREAHQDNAPLHPQVADLPATRQEAIARGISAPALTQEDVAEFHYHTRTHFFNNTPSHGGRSVSETLDVEWFRLVSCHDLWDVERPLRGVVYSLGTFAGNWSGRMIVPDTQAHINAPLDYRIPPNSVQMVQERLSCRFEEHHCLRFSEPLIAPPCPGGSGGEDILNAWLPRNTRIRRKANGLQIFDPNTGKDTWYETYCPDRTQPYSAAACQRLLNESGMGWYRRSLSASAADDEEYEDYVEETLSGVLDIIITGETSEKQGEAWGYYSYIGRVRRWDGLVVLLRIPVRSPFIPCPFPAFHIFHHRSGGQTGIR